MSKTWHIYSLTDSLDNRVRYIGKAVNTKRRLHFHIWEALNSKARNHRLNWIRSAVESGQMPQLSILESGEGNWVEAEKKWIKNFRDAGYDLVNATDGGEGAEGYKHSAETLAKMSAVHGNISAETRAKMSAANKGRKCSPETRDKLSAAHKGRKHSLETCARISAVQKGRKQSAETCAKRNAALKGRKRSPEARARMSAAKKLSWAKRKQEAAK